MSRPAPPGKRGSGQKKEFAPSAASEEVAEQMKEMKVTSSPAPSTSASSAAPAPASAAAPSPTAVVRGSLKSSAAAETLFAKSEESASKVTQKKEDEGGGGEGGEMEELSMPTHIGSARLKAVPSTFTGSMPADGGGDSSDSDSDSSDDGGALLSTKGKATAGSDAVEGSAAWKAKYDDLTSRRRDFHGAVAYAFGGVFSWSMYSAAEAKDEAGNPYTEYLMRCQWGVDWNSMQPWIVARRFREFVALDGDLRRIWGQSGMDGGDKFPDLPSRFNLFGSDRLDDATVESRKVQLEEYMVCIIQNFPLLMKSSAISRFVGVKERVKAIRAQLAAAAGPEEDETAFDYGKKGADIMSGKSVAPGTIAQLKSDKDTGPSQPEFSTFDTVIALANALLDTDKADLILTSGVATFIPLDDDQLGVMEEDLVTLKQLQRSYTPKKYLLSTKVGDLMTKCSLSWPALKLSASFPSDDASGGPTANPALVPRAMQVDEDLSAAVNEFKSLLIAVGLTPSRR